MSGRPVLVEHVEQDGERYDIEWYCTPPADGATYTVLRDEWDADQPIRRIYEITLLPDA